ncbi:MAG TPA: hypothetical protein PKE63_07540 [Lacibacter sp.]|nr:hypothetical protein [Lacibacter sp.]HMO89037.1 hypothetical protein [Lacibacter sp.]HMP87116.1 hypothetical protein [Lacibacter sp.]
MKKLSILFSFFFLVSFAFAQTKTATFKVWGNCGMCKTTIEGAAKNSGATIANWDVNSKMLTVTYKPSKTSEDKIQKGIADVGYDNEKYTAPDEVYNNLHGCCKYDRKTASAPAAAGACCMKEGKCEGNKDCCKKSEGKSDCCKQGTCSAEGGCCASCKMKEGKCCSGEGKAACTHEGACKDKKEGHAATCTDKSCCKS